MQQLQVWHIEDPQVLAILRENRFFCRKLAHSWFDYETDFLLAWGQVRSFPGGYAVRSNGADLVLEIGDIDTYLHKREMEEVSKELGVEIMTLGHTPPSEPAIYDDGKTAQAVYPD